MSQPLSRTKRCSHPDCGLVKPFDDFYAQAASPDGFQRWCKDCSRRARLEWAKRNRRRLRFLDRRVYRRRRADPDRASAERVRKREWERKARGTDPANYRSSPYMPKGGVEQCPRLPAGPFADWLRTLADRPAHIAARVGLSDRTVGRILRGENVTVELDTVDRALLAHGRGVTLDDLYPISVAA